MVLALNTTTGLVADVPPHFLVHDMLKEVLVAVDEDSKPIIAEPQIDEVKVDKTSKTSITTTTKDEI
jgi:hypothetical protein